MSVHVLLHRLFSLNLQKFIFKIFLKINLPYNGTEIPGLF